MTQNSLGNALNTLGERESGTARLEGGVKAWELCLVVVASAWRWETMEEVRSRRDRAQAKISRRTAR